VATFNGFGGKGLSHGYLSSGCDDGPVELLLGHQNVAFTTLNDDKTLILKSGLLTERLHVDRTVLESLCLANT
jgi:hypothetical protein